MKKSNVKYWQQGDVLLIKIDKSEVKGEKIKGVVVQEGEHTGHAHRFNGQENIVSLFGTEEQKYLTLTDTATLYHEEHLPVTIEKGDYEVRIIRQKDPFTKLISRVVD